MVTGVPTLKSVLVSGGTGFVGSAVVRAVAERHPNCKITVIDWSPPGAHDLPKDISFVQLDIMSSDDVHEVVAKAKPDILIHTAGIVPALSERFRRRLEKHVWKINVDGTKNMLDAARRVGVQGFIYTGSCCAVTDSMDVPLPNIDERWPRPRSSLIYGESKAAAEAMVLNASSESLPTCSLRPSVLCGPGDYQLIPAVHACIEKRETPFIIGDGLNLWDVTYVANVADAHVLAAENLISSRTAAGEAFFIQNNEPITFRTFCLAVWAHFGHYPPFQLHIPSGLAFIIGLILECVTWITCSTTTLTRGSVRDACSVRYAKGDKAKEVLGYEPRVGIEDGIRLSCEVGCRYPTLFQFPLARLWVTQLQDYARRMGVTLPARSELRQGFSAPNGLEYIKQPGLYERGARPKKGHMCF